MHIAGNILYFKTTVLESNLVLSSKAAVGVIVLNCHDLINDESEFLYIKVTFDTSMPEQNGHHVLEYIIKILWIIALYLYLDCVHS